jgi:hypothetical protein
VAKKVKSYTLSQIAESAGVSLPTAQKYKVNGDLDDYLIAGTDGRNARYSSKAIRALSRLRDDGLSRRGRPPVS